MNTEDKQFDELMMLLTEGARPATEDADAILNAGYRKASYVAEDIIRMLRAGGITEWRYPIVAEIKKKYMVGKDTQAVYKHRTPNGATYITSEPVSAESENAE